MFKIVKCQKGSGLLYILFFSMFLTIITLPLLQGSMLSLTHSIGAMDKLTANNAVNEAYEIKMKEILSLDPDSHPGEAGTTTKTINGIPVSVNITVNSFPAPYTDTAGDIEFDVRATVNGTTSRMWSQINYLNMANYAFFSQGTNGNVVTNGGAARLNSAVFPRFDRSLSVTSAAGDRTVGWGFANGMHDAVGGRWINGFNFAAFGNPANLFFSSDNGLQVNMLPAPWGLGIAQILAILFQAFTGNAQMTFHFDSPGSDIIMNQPTRILFFIPYNRWDFNGAIISRGGINGVPPAGGLTGLRVNLNATARTNQVSNYINYSYNGGPSLITSSNVRRW